MAVDPPKSRQFKSDFAAKVKALHKVPILAGAVKVTLDIYRNFKTAINQRFGDVDNLAKGILDACTGIIWKDDRQITDLHVKKFVTDCKPYIEMTVEVV